MAYTVPVPDISEDSVISLLKSNTRALLLIMFELFTEPVLVLFPSFNVPAEIVVEPVKVFVPDNVKVPEPAFVKLPAPLITPEIKSSPPSPVVKVIPLASSIFPDPLKD